MTTVTQDVAMPKVVQELQMCAQEERVEIDCRHLSLYVIGGVKERGGVGRRLPRTLFVFLFVCVDSCVFV